MKTYVFRINFKGHFYEDSIRAYSWSDAKKFMELRYPGASIVYLRSE